jgi:hypothetical protein
VPTFAIGVYALVVVRRRSQPPPPPPPNPVDHVVSCTFDGVSAP